MPDDGSWGLNEIAFLQKKSDAGNLVIVQGDLTGSSTAVVVSYTPANGKTFVIYKAKISLASPGGNTGQAKIQLRNNATVLEIGDITPYSSGGSSGVITISQAYDYIVRCDILVGDGAKTYDLKSAVLSTGLLVHGTIEGYLE